VVTQLHSSCSSFYVYPGEIEARFELVRSGDRFRTSCAHEERSIVNNIPAKTQVDWICVRHDGLLHTIIEGRIEGREEEDWKTTDDWWHHGKGLKTWKEQPSCRGRNEMALEKKTTDGRDNMPRTCYCIVDYQKEKKRICLKVVVNNMISVIYFIFLIDRFSDEMDRQRQLIHQLKRNTLAEVDRRTPVSFSRYQSPMISTRRRRWICFCYRIIWTG